MTMRVHTEENPGWMEFNLAKKGWRGSIIRDGARWYGKIENINAAYEANSISELIDQAMFAVEKYLEGSEFFEFEKALSGEYLVMYQAEGIAIIEPELDEHGFIISEAENGDRYSHYEDGSAAGYKHSDHDLIMKKITTPRKDED